MTNRKFSYDVGDLVEAVWLDRNKMPALTGIVVGFPKGWHGQKIDILWNEIGMRTEWLNDIRKIKTG